MNTIRRASLLGILCGTMLLPFTSAAPRPLAKLYPGAIRDTAASNAYRIVLLTHDPIDKVRAYYESRVGKLVDAEDYSVRDNDGRAMMCHIDGLTICYGKILMSQGNVARYLKHVTDAYDAGLRLEARRSERPAQPPSDSASEAALANAGMFTNAQLEAARAKLMAEVHGVSRSEGMDPDKLDSIAQMSDLFDGFKDEVASRRHSEDELLRLHARYGQLESAVYPYVSDGANSLTSYDRWLLKRKEAAFTRSTELSDREKQELSNRLQQLYAAGKFDEAKKLTQRLTAGASRDHWSYWVGFLEDLDAHAYRTRIIIDVDPRSWGRKR